MDLRCSSCGRRVEAAREWVEFTCPGCGKDKVTRCEGCKSSENPYECKCGFAGP